MASQTIPPILKLYILLHPFNLDFESAPLQMLQAKFDRAIILILIAMNYRVIYQFPGYPGSFAYQVSIFL